jgi:chemotaxis protein histidine kinase CheA
MNIDSKAGDRVYASFVIEAAELLQQLERDLLSLRQECSLNKVHNLMRTTHTLKGMAASVGLETLKQVAHSLEDVFKALYNPAVAIDAQIEALLFQFYECLRLPVAAEITQTAWDESEVAARAAAVFAQLQDKLGCSGQDVSLPTAAELGVDITQSIFAGDVSNRLAVLADAIAQMDTAQVAAVLQQQATVFLGLAEALELPSFGAIAQNALAALNAFPDRAVSIAQIALSDWQQVRSTILAREQGRQGEQGEKSGSGAGEAGEETTIQNPKSKIQNSLAPAPLPLAPAPSTIRVECGKLEHLNDLNTDLLAHQIQQTAIERQSEETLQRLQQQLQQHQQNLDRLWNWTQKLLGQPDGQQSSTISKTEIVARNYLMRLFQSLRTEAMQLTVTTGEVVIFHHECSQASARQQRLLAQMHLDLTQAKTSPLGEVFLRLQRVLQQLVAVYGKPTQLQQSGTDILVDKAIADRLYEILLHLIRNAFDHGIESPVVRRQLGKAPTGQIRLDAYQQEQWIIVELSDDGKGLDWEKIIARALEMNLLSWEQAMSRTQDELLNLLFVPGFSTATQVNDLSGRGMGLDVVRAQLELLKGEVKLKSEPHQGTTFTLRLPHSLNPLSISSERLDPPQLLSGDNTSRKLALQQHQPQNFSLGHFPAANSLEGTLKTDSLFIWLTKAAVFFLPYANIAEYVVPQPEQIVRLGQQRFLTWCGQTIPLYCLTQLLKYNYPVHSTLNLAEDDATLTLVIHQEERILAIESAMQRLVTKTEIAIAPCDRSIAFPSYIYGCTVWEDRRLLLAIDVMSLVQAGRR